MVSKKEVCSDEQKGSLIICDHISSLLPARMFSVASRIYLSSSLYQAIEWDGRSIWYMRSNVTDGLGDLQAWQGLLRQCQQQIMMTAFPALCFRIHQVPKWHTQLLWESLHRWPPLWVPFLRMLNSSKQVERVGGSNFHVYWLAGPVRDAFHSSKPAQFKVFSTPMYMAEWCKQRIVR